MSPDAMVGHLAATLRYSMGRSGRGRCAGGPLARYILRPIMLSGLVPFPKNLKTDAYVGSPNPFFGPGDLENLHATLLEYLDLVQTGELQSEPHPFFGDIGVDGWARLHVLHFKHHMRQFGI